MRPYPKLLFLVLACTSCASAAHYPGIDSPDATVLIRGQQAWTSMAFIEAVDGNPLRDRNRLFPEREVKQVRVTPGPHEIAVSWVGDVGFRSTTDAVLELNAEPGHEYEVRGGSMPDPSTVVSLRIFGGSSRWTAWIIDTQTRRVVAGFCPPDRVDDD